MRFFEEIVRSFRETFREPCLPFDGVAGFRRPQWLAESLLPLAFLFFRIEPARLTAGTIIGTLSTRKVRRPKLGIFLVSWPIRFGPCQIDLALFLTSVRPRLALDHCRQQGAERIGARPVSAAPVFSFSSDDCCVLISETAICSSAACGRTSAFFFLGFLLPNRLPNCVTLGIRREQDPHAVAKNHSTCSASKTQYA